ncbi:MAG TPA: hypothetical protein VK783_05110 [Bacteroidia bacterium]|nr:hypothetical protein [Bacteroidia bacterium]
MHSNTSNKKTKVFCCAECGQIEVRGTTPSTDGCRRYPFHRWVNLGETGKLAYTCEHCKVTVRTVSTPASFGCKENKFHKWVKGS